MEIKSKTIKPDIRYLNDMKRVLYDQEWAKKAKNFAVYYMYRGLKPRRRAFGSLRGKEKDSLRYDITDFTSRMLGQEFPKTKGHKHSSGCFELITVLKGKAIFLLQKCKRKKVLDVYQISAKKGDWIIAPAGYSHITINPGPERLKIANWIDERCQGIYDFIEKTEGACYYYIKDGWIKNKNYGKVPKLRFEKPLKRIPKNLEFLSYGNS